MEEHKQQENTNRTGSKINVGPYIAIGIVVFCVIALSMLLFFVLFRLDGVFSGVQRVLGTLQAVVIGVILAYLLNPIVKWFENHLFRPQLSKKITDRARISKISRVLSIVVTYVVFLAVIIFLLSILLPRLIETLFALSDDLPTSIRELVSWITAYTESNPALSRIVRVEAFDLSSYLQDLIKNDLPGWMQSMMEFFTSGIMNVFKLAMNIIIGFIVSVYVLIDKEKFICQGKKIVYALFAPKAANAVVKTTRKAHEIFIGFVVGRIEDSIIIGLITAVILALMHMPYTIVVAIIVGVFNVIPFFGPILGAIPSLFLIMLDDPVKAFYFLIFIIIIQEFDGNILGPKIVGHSIGLSAFWIVVAVMLGTGMFGIVGMLAGVPLFAIILYIINELIKNILRKKKLPEDSKDYLDVDRINADTGELIYKAAAIKTEQPADNDKQDKQSED